MRKVLILTAIFMLGASASVAATRDTSAVSRTAPAVQTSRATTARTTSAVSRTAPAVQTSRATTARTATVASRTTSTARPARIISRPVTTDARTSRATAARAATAVVSRAADTPATSMTETRTGADYERCKTAYFTCMDQFCMLKNDDYRRCSCNNRVSDLMAKRDVLQEAGQQLTVFTENLDTVGMTAAQAAAMRTASEGENALTSDKSASKALLQAIMNSITGKDSNVGGKYSDLNSISISFDTANAFGVSDSGQLIASYNGQNLYNAVYPQCRAAVRADCNDASLQRAITAYLMAVEQDCNTVQTAIESTQSKMKAAVREGGAMLNLARVENRQNHNSSDLATCIAEVEKAILSEEVCGAGYHRCLDNGEFIDITTGTPIAGVARFYELAELLTFVDGVAITDQKLARIPRNQTFVHNFENRTKKFAAPALDKCVEIADVAWSEYLDKAILDIYYAQRAKVSEIKQGCFDFVSSCYMNGDKALTAAMSDLIGENNIILQPGTIALSTALCRDYVESCNNMFDGNIIAQYIETRQNTDTLAACRAVAQQCFDKYGGANFENFYYPSSGLFSAGQAPLWFSLYKYEASTDENGKITWNKSLASPCAKQLAEIEECKSDEILERAFGGMDAVQELHFFMHKTNYNTVYCTNDSPGACMLEQNDYYNDETMLPMEYGLFTDNTHLLLSLRKLRPTGVATEIYNQIIDGLSTQCMNINGRFVEMQFMRFHLYPDRNNLCLADFHGKHKITGGSDDYYNLYDAYKIGDNEDMCPHDYNISVDTRSWGACLCFENGGRRSKWGRSATCLPVWPTTTKQDVLDAKCDDNSATDRTKPTDAPSIYNWCSLTPTAKHQICPPGYDPAEETYICTKGRIQLFALPDGL